MMGTTTTPAVYVGTYHKYNCGSIFGKWFDLTDFDSKDAFYAACHALHADEADPEFMFQDWEGIPSAFAGESYIDWYFIDAYKRALADGMEQAFTVWSDYFDDCDYDLFQDAWCGEAGSEEDYARELAEECGLLQDVPESLRGYFDFEAFARDMFMNDFVFLEGYVFRH